jgi:hypothetical protein
MEIGVGGGSLVVIVTALLIFPVRMRYTTKILKNIWCSGRNLNLGSADYR